MFKPFNEEVVTAKSKRRLPGWEQEETTQDVTFRLADSIPKKVLDAWEVGRRELG